MYKQQSPKHLILMGDTFLLLNFGSGCTPEVTPRRPDVVARYEMVTAGNDLTCAVLPAGGIYCWGDNTGGGFGDGTSEQSLDGALTNGISDAIEGAAGSKYACAVLSNGTMSCWGKFVSSLLPVSVTGISGATHVATGGNHVCMVTAVGTVKCWGAGLSGQLGNDLTNHSPTPVNVVGISTATAVTAGDEHSCALLRNGDVMCWGNNNVGQLGNSSNTQSAKALTVPGIRATTIAAGGNHSCALLPDGTIKCWGWTSDGALGNGVVAPGGIPNPVPVSETTGAILTGAIAVAAGHGHTCAILGDRTVRCWGRNMDGQLGSGTTSPKGIPNPVQVSGITSAVAITTGFRHTCVLLKDNAIKCWGNNKFGQLTDGTDTNSPVPVP